MSFEAAPVPQPMPARVRQVATDRPWVWLAAGWHDLMAAPQIGFAYGLALTFAGWVLAGLMLWAGIAWAILPATAGFFLVAPLLAAGLYETSRRREQGEPVSLPLALRGFARNGTQIGFVGVVLLVVHLFWVRTAGLLFALFFGLGFAPPLEQLPMAMLRSDQLLPFLVVGTGVGAIFATFAFMVSAVSIPMLVDREISALEAMATSVQAVASNWRAMAFWAGLIVVFTAMALAPFFLGLALVLPLIGHATWHAYKDLVR
jgi:uncharacterized membrane protein